jgi:hypothetical protein
MRLLWIIILVGLSTFLGAQSTYFNMRYPEIGKWGGSTKSIVSYNNTLYMNKLNVVDTTGFLEQTFVEIDIVDGQEFKTSVIKTDSVNYYSGSLFRYSNGGFYDVMTRVETINGDLSLGYKVVKYHDNGDTVFTRINRDTVPFMSILDIKEAVDKGIIMTGIVREKPYDQGGHQNILLIKLDSLGNEQWRKDYGNTTYEELGYSVSTTSDHGYIIGGAVYHPNFSDEQRPYIIKTDSVGNVEWEQVYGALDTNNLPAYNIINTQDGGYAFVGGKGIQKYTGPDVIRPWLVKIDYQGNLMWSRMNNEGVPTHVFSEYHDLIELSDGNLVVCGAHVRLNLDTVNFKGKYSSMGVIAKYSKNGDLLWCRSFVHPENLQSPWSDHTFKSITQTDDGGFSAAGYLLPNPPDTGTQDTWVVKVDSFGCLVQGCEVVSVPQIETSIASLKIYPNPTNGILNIEITPNGNQHQFNFELYDILGKRVHTQKLIPYHNTISVSGLTSGIYTYKIDEVWGKIVVE